jgi:hypothetical protein
MPDNEESLQVYWDEIWMARSRPPLEDPQGPQTLFDSAEPGDMVLGTSKRRILVVIKADGTLIYGPDYCPDKAAEIFWESMAQRREAYEERSLIIRHMEAILVRLGGADMQAEHLRQLAERDPTPGNEQSARQSILALEQVMSQAIELGRGLIRRPDIPVPAVPERVPPSIEANPNSEYRGGAGLEES